MRRQKEERKSRKGYVFLLFAPLISFCIYAIYLGVNPFTTITTLLIPYNGRVNYDTYTIQFEDGVSDEIKSSIKDVLEDVKLNDINRFEFKDSGNTDITIKSGSDGEVVFEKSWIPVGHIYWVKSKTKLEDLKKSNILISSNNYEETERYLKEYLGNDVSFTVSNDLVNDLKNSESKIGLINAKDLNEDLKVLYLDNKYFLDESEGGINIVYSASGLDEEDSNIYAVMKRYLADISDIDFDEENVVKINMTGVTAISRGLGRKIDNSGDSDYPAQKIGSFLSDADLTHTSNEVSFVENCTMVSGMRFCAKPQYIDTLKAIGADIIELTGNHNNDYGASNNTKSINMYKDLGWDYFGGGLDATDASKILYKEVKGNTIAFIGYNYYDTMLNTGAIATDSHAGGNRYSDEILMKDIDEAKLKADVIIVDFQWQECYCYPSSDVIYPICYKPLSSPDQVKTFRLAIDYGADVVIGTQAHQPQTYEKYNGGLIYYGLGNLFFDQINWIGTRQGLIVSLYIKDGDVIQGRLTPTMYDNDMITRVATDTESDTLLKLLKSARSF